MEIMKPIGKIFASLIYIPVLILLLSGVDVNAADKSTRKPSILLCCWRADEREIDLDYLKELQHKGFVVDYLDKRSDFTWERIRQYNAIILYDFPCRGKVNITPHGNPGTGPNLDATLALLNRYLKAGGGVMVNLQYLKRPEFYSATAEALKKWGASAPMDMVVVPDSSIAQHHRLRVPYMLTRNIDHNTPVSKGVKSVWYPQSLQHSHFPNTMKSGIIVVDGSWQVVVKAPQGSHSEPLIYEKLPPQWHIKDVQHLPSGTKEPALFAIRDKVDGGRLALFRMWPVFHIGAGKSYIQDGAVMDKGLNGVPSDFGLLLENSLRWLAAPSLASGKLGGAKPEAERLEYKNLKPDIKEKYTTPKKNVEISLSAPFKPVKLFKGVVGPRTTCSNGKASVAEYAKTAKEIGLDYIIFLEDFRSLSPDGLKKLKAECRKYSDKNLLLFPGYQMKTNLGSRIMLFGQDPDYPYAKVLTGPDNKTFKLQNINKDGKFVAGQQDSFRFNLYNFSRKTGPKRIRLNSVGYFDFTRAKEQGAPQLFDSRGYGMAGVVFYEDGKLIEDVTDQYLLMNQCTMSAVPVAVNLIDSPDALKKMVKAGRGVTYASARSLDKLWVEALVWNTQVKRLCVFPSTGPQIHGWGLGAQTSATQGAYGAEAYVPDWSLAIRDLRVTSDKGLKEVAVYDGAKLWRRFLPNGAKEFKERLFFNSTVQKNLSVVATDTAGGKAVSFPVRTWKFGSLAPVFCGDHVNDCLFCNLQHGPGWQKLNRAPMVNNYGYTWDGGPKPVSPILCLGTPLPLLTPADGQRQSRELYQIPLLGLCDEKVLRTTSYADRILEQSVKGNSWTGLGPIQLAELFKARSTSTEFIQANLGVDPVSHWYDSTKTGPIPCYFEQEMTFLKDFTIKNLVLSYMWRRRPPFKGETVVFGKDEKMVSEHDLAKLAGKKNYRYKLMKDGWFAGIGPVEGNAQLYINNSDNPLVLDINIKGNRLSAQPSAKPWKVKKDEVYKTEIFTMTWPVDQPIKDAAALLRVIRYLKQPDGLQLSRGERIIGPIGLQRLKAERGAVALTVPKPSDGLSLPLAFRVENINPRWTAVEWLKKGYKGKEYYGKGENRFRELGIDESGRIYFPVYVGFTSETSLVVGHPVVADIAGTELFIQVTCLSDREYSGTGKPLWHIAVNNPTDNAITAVISKNMNLPGLEGFREIKLRLSPGERRVLYHNKLLK